MDFYIIPDEDALNHCTWCGGRIDEFSDVFSVDAGIRPGVDLSPYQGHCIQLDLVSRKKSLDTMVTADDSEAKAQQKDLLFLVCSEKCAAKLKTVLKEEMARGDLVGRV